jgi:hypothetical protein
MYKFIIKFVFTYWDDIDEMHMSETMTFIDSLSYSDISDEYIQKICQDKLINREYAKFSHVKSIKQIKTKA